MMSLVYPSLPADVTTYWVYVYYSSGSVIGTKSCADIYIVDDNHLESNEVFYGTIQPLTEGCTCTLPCAIKSTTLLYNSTAYITINDDEGEQMTLIFIFYACAVISNILVRSMNHSLEKLCNAPLD